MRHGQAPAGTVVATDPASVDADCDNGTTVQNTPRSAGRDRGTAHRLACEAREEAESRTGVAAALEQVQVLEGVPAFCYRLLPGRGSANASLIT